MLDAFTVQALTYDPARFPDEPERFSGGLAVRVWDNGLVTSSPYGHARGAHVALEVFVGSDGKRHYRFPITIDPPR